MEETAGEKVLARRKLLVLEKQKEAGGSARGGEMGPMAFFIPLLSVFQKTFSPLLLWKCPLLDPIPPEI